MLRKGARKPPKKRPSVMFDADDLPWLAAVEYIKHRTRDDSYRLRVLQGLQGWQDFASAWLSCGRDVLESKYPHAETFIGPRFLLELNAWTWYKIEQTPIVSTALEMTDQICNLSSVDTVHVFQSLRSSLLLYADGSVHPIVLQIVKDEASSQRLKYSLQSTRRLVENIRQTNTLKKLQEGMK